MTEDEMVRWHHRLNGHEFEQILGGEGGSEDDRHAESTSDTQGGAHFPLGRPFWAPSALPLLLEGRVEKIFSPP